MKRIALIGENSIEYVEKLLNIWNDGNCAVLIDCQVPPKTAVEMMIEAQVHVCYIEMKYYNRIYEINDTTINVIPYNKTNILAQLLPESLYNKFQSNYNSDEALILYSSGTTGKSRGIILTHFAINTNADAIIDYMQPSKRDCIYIVKSFAHSSTITGELLVALKRKTPLLIAPVVMPPRYVLSNIVKYGVSIIGVNPLLLSMYCDECQNKNYDFSLLKKVYVSGAILSDEIYMTAHNVFYKQEIYNVYVLSEAGPRVTAQRRDCCKGNSVGKTIKGVEIAIVDENGKIVSNGNHGIIHIKSPSRFTGYVQGTIKHKSLYYEWLNTGDVGYFDEFDELHIIGRIDDMIIIGGHKIYPFEVEKQIQYNSDIRECVVALIHFRGEGILCCLYVSGKKIRKDIKNALGSVLMKYEIPKIFIKTDMIPRTRNGKISLNDVKEVMLRELKGVQ